VPDGVPRPGWPAGDGAVKMPPIMASSRDSMTGTSRLMPADPAPAPGGHGDPDAVIGAAVARSGTSFYWAMRLLPPPRRAAMFAVYAFCRAVDDVVDEPGTPAAKVAGLAEWRLEVDRIFAGRATTDIGRALTLAVGRYDMAREDFLAVIDGMAMDMGEPLRRPTLAELELYCDRVAVAVGRLSVCAFGTPAAQGRRLAHALGRAFQLTNILRDLVEDAGLGRLYLPDEWLSEAGIASADPAVVLRHPALGVVCRRPDRKSTRLNSSHTLASRMPSSA